jgi:hypothetical protein
MNKVEPCEMNKMPKLISLNKLSFGVDSNIKLKMYDIKYGIIPFNKKLLRFNLYCFKIFNFTKSIQYTLRKDH